MTRQTYETIRQTCTLPSATDVAREILRVANDESATIAQVAAVVENDPATAARLLKLVNSPLAGVSRKIASVPQAVGLLGLETVKSTAVAFSLVSNFKEGPCGAFDYERFWSESIAAAVTARHLAHRLKNIAADEAFTCGLCCQIGRLAFATAYPERYAALLDQIDAGDPSSLSQSELDAFGMNHDQLAAEMMADWSLPVVFCNAVRRMDETDDDALDASERVVAIARTLHLAVAISHIFVPLVTSRKVLASLTNEANRLGIGPFVFAEVFDSVSQEWRDIGSIFDVRTRKVPPLAEIYTRGTVG